MIRPSVNTDGSGGTTPQKCSSVSFLVGQQDESTPYWHRLEYHQTADSLIFKQPVLFFHAG